MITFRKNHQTGFTLIEMLVVIAITGILMLALSNVVGEATSTHSNLRQSNDLNREAAFVMRYLERVIGRSNLIDERENTPVRVLYHLGTDPERDINKDGFPDVDNDKDGRIDEDDSGDMNGDGWPGIRGKDDDADGLIDEGGIDDDDEDGVVDEDLLEQVQIEWDNGVFKEHRVVPFDRNGDGVVDNTDISEYTLSENIAQFKAAYTNTGRYPLFDVTLVFDDKTGYQLTLKTKIRVGGRL